MRNIRLIFVEGLPGLGKTTTASWLASRLPSQRLVVNLFEEHQLGHPLNVGGDLHPAGSTPGEAFFQRYTPASFVRESLEKWQGFVRAAVQTEALNVLNSYPFQNTVRVLCNRMHQWIHPRLCRPGRSLGHAPATRAHIFWSPGQYFRDSSPERHDCARGQAWRDYAMKLITHSSYAQARHLEGFEGVSAFIVDYKQGIDSLVSRSCLPRIVLEDGTESWEERYGKIESFLGLR